MQLPTAASAGSSASTASLAVQNLLAAIDAHKAAPLPSGPLNARTSNHASAALPAGKSEVLIKHEASAPEHSFLHEPAGGAPTSFGILLSTPCTRGPLKAERVATTVRRESQVRSGVHETGRDVYCVLRTPE